MPEKVNLSDVFRGKKVFLTGHTGFKGTWFLWMLKELGAQVKGYALPPDSKEALFSITQADKACESVLSDIRDREALIREIALFKPDFIYHFAAQALVLDGYKTPVETYQTNVMGTAHLLDALQNLKNPCTAVIITTDKVYENLEINYPYKETDKLGGYDPYSSSKACCEILVSSWRRSFLASEHIDKHGKALSTARSGNVIGGGDRAENRIIPDLIQAFENNISLLVRNPESVRPWQHVLEPLRGYLMLGALMHKHPGQFCDAYNFGPAANDTLTVKELVETAIQTYRGGRWHTDTSLKQPHEAGLLQLNVEKAKTDLGWTPRFNARTSVEQTIKWYMESKGNPREYTLEQIRKYLSL
jgi:CDP-glucose 4,6-dehydratase